MSPLVRAALSALALSAAASSCSAGPDPGPGALPVGGRSGAPAASPADEFAFAFPAPSARPADGPASNFPDGADPRTPLGELRAARLPVWVRELDWAFPPEVCGSAWELDAVAEPLPDDTAIPAFWLGASVPVAAALAVMRYEHLLSEALAAPSPLGQLCVAVAAVDPVRSEDLSELASYLEAGSRRADLARHPDEVTVVAVAPTSVLAAACVEPGYPAVVSADGEIQSEPRAPARLQVYLLKMTQGLEDDVADASLRVTTTHHRPAEDCGELVAWAGEWRDRAQQWVSEGQLWELVDIAITADDICATPSSADAPEAARECPDDWSRPQTALPGG